MGEYFRDNGMHALIIYDDLSKQAVAYRQMRRCCCAARRAAKLIRATFSICTTFARARGEAERRQQVRVR
ncbi:MAG: hypothetical protein R3C30_04815 [Hyphomonadaceae bacterium]